MIKPCASCDMTTCWACPHWATFECDLCNRESCEDCSQFRYAVWVLEGMLEKPELEAVFWPCR